MTKLRLGLLCDDKPVKIAVELPAAVHREAMATGHRISWGMEVRDERITDSKSSWSWARPAGAEIKQGPRIWEP